jgi:hypothetical protein
MTFVYLLLGMAAFCSVFGVFRSLVNSSSTKRRENEAGDRRPKRKASMPFAFEAQRLLKKTHWIHSEELPKMLRTNGDFILRWIRAREEPFSEEYLPGEIAVTNRINSERA